MSAPGEEEIPDWEVEEEKIPERLENKWKKDEEKGLKAGVCRACGWVFTQDELSCAHCGKSTEMSDGTLIALKRWFFKTPLGQMTLVLIFAAVAAFLFRH